MYIPGFITPPVALRVAAILALINADERRLAGILAWLARDWTTPDEAFSIAVCNCTTRHYQK